MNITNLALSITTSVDGRNGISLEIGYYSNFGNVPLFQTLSINPSGTYIGSTLQVSLDSTRLAADINTIFSLRVVADVGTTPLWVPSTVTSCQTTDSGGTKVDLVKNVVIKSATATFYTSNPPRPGVRGFLYDTATINAGGTPAITVKAGQTLTVRVDPSQRWSMEGVDSNCNGPLHSFDAPFLTRAEGSLNYTHKRGAFVITLVTQGNTTWPAVIPVGNYLRVPVLADGTITWNVWDDAYAGNKGKLGVEIEVSDFDFNEYAANPVPGSAGSVVIKPQINCFNMGNSGLLDTQLDLKLGDVLHLRCDPYDTWVINAGTNLSVNANGIFSPTSGQNNPVANYYSSGGNYRYFANGCLIGTLDDGKSWFGVGTWLDMTVLQAGRLKLTCWDDSQSNNTGDITAQFWTTAAPYMPGGSSSQTTDASKVDITINPGGVLVSNVMLTNNGSSDVDLQGLTVLISTARPQVGWYTFATSTVVKVGANVKIWVGSDKPGEPSFKSNVPLLYGPGKDRVSLVRIIKDKSS